MIALSILLVFIGLFNTVINFLLAPRSKVPQAKRKRRNQNEPREE